jgi:hypothetical protein
MNSKINQIDYYFYIMILRDGTHLPWIRIHNAGPASMLERLSILDMRKVGFVNALIEKINKSTGKFYFHHFILTLEIEENETTVFEDSAQSLPFVMETSKLLEILIGWSEFLLAYENGEIPGVIPQDKKS